MAPARAELGLVASQLSASLLRSRQGKAAQRGGSLCPYAWSCALSALPQAAQSETPNSASPGAPGVPMTQSCSESCPNAGLRFYHFPHAGGSHPLCSLQHCLQRAHQVTLSAPPALPPRIKGQHGFTPRSCSNKGSPHATHGQRADGTKWVSTKALGGSSVPAKRPAGCPAEAPIPAVRDAMSVGDRWGISLGCCYCCCPAFPYVGTGGSGHGYPLRR